MIAIHLGGDELVFAQALALHHLGGLGVGGENLSRHLLRQHVVEHRAGHSVRLMKLRGKPLAFALQSLHDVVRILRARDGNVFCARSHDTPSLGPIKS